MTHGIVHNVFGLSKRIVRRWEDGTAACPFCAYPCDQLDVCQNPGCVAYPTLPLAIALRREAEQRQREAEESERARVLRIRARSFVGSR